MSGPDASAQALLGQDAIWPATLCWLDILGDPIRVTTAPYSLAFSNTGDPDLDGFTFSAVDPTVVSVSQVGHKEGGADSVTCTLSGLAGIDATLLDQLGNRANWQGRTARLWRLMLDPTNLTPGTAWAYYTGYMTVPKIVGDAKQQTIQLTIESYLAYLSQASNRSYLTQSDYDAGDLSAEPAIAIANGINGAGLASNAAVGGGGVGGGSLTLADRADVRML